MDLNRSSRRVDWLAEFSVRPAVCGLPGTTWYVSTAEHAFGAVTIEITRPVRPDAAALGAAVADAAAALVLARGPGIF